MLTKWQKAFKTPCALNLPNRRVSFSTNSGQPPSAQRPRTEKAAAALARCWQRPTVGQIPGISGFWRFDCADFRSDMWVADGRRLWVGSLVTDILVRLSVHKRLDI